jgi:hypothetical protein
MPDPKRSLAILEDYAKEEIDVTQDLKDFRRLVGVPSAFEKPTLSFAGIRAYAAVLRGHISDFLCTRFCRR